MPYSYHQNLALHPLSFPVGKVVCVGRNYAAHARELNNPVLSKPLLFMKPSTALTTLTTPIRLPHHGQQCGYELEVAVLIQQALTRAEPMAAWPAIAGYGLALDLTLRDVQEELKANGHPWELAKAFDQSCPLSPFVSATQIADPAQLSLQLQINGEIRQDGTTADMILAIPDLLAYISTFFTLLPGDVVLTGTPAGVGILQPGDRLLMTLAGEYRFQAEVAHY